MLDKMESQKFFQRDYITLCQEILYHDKLYYVDFSPIISDYEYDQLIFLLLSIEKKYPDWIVKWSPSQRIGDRNSGSFSVIQHAIPMISIANAYDKEDLMYFINKIKRLHGMDLFFDIELKIDGIAVSLIYEKGIFTRAVSRGNGVEGEDITANVKVIKSLPLYLYGNFPQFLEVRGEIFFTKKNFKKLNFLQEKQNKPLFTNARNAAGGTLKLLNPSEAAKRELSLIVYNVTRIDGDYETYSHYENLMLCRKWGFSIEKSLRKEQSLENILNIIDNIKQQRPFLEYEIDGVVIKVDDVRVQNILGRTAKHTRWGIAYKFSPEQAITKVSNIIVQVGRSGILTPVAILEPIFLCGSTISRVTLHNQEEIIRKGIGIGDYLVIEKAGDVIPKVVCVDLSKRESLVIPWRMPKLCPSCSSSLIKDEDKVALKCPNYKTCPEQIIGQINFFVGKNGLNIDHMGEKVVENLFYQGLVRRKSDIFFLDEINLASLPNFKKKSINNLLIAIENSKTVKLSHFITALGIPFVGKETACLIAEYTKTLSQFLQISSTSKEDLLKIHGIGERVTDSIIAFLSDKENLEDIYIMIERNIIVLDEKRISLEVFSQNFLGKTFVLTGSLKNFTRNEAISLIEKRGGQISSTISKKVNYLICGDSPGSKKNHAENLNIQIFNEDEFLKLLNV